MTVPKIANYGLLSYRTANVGDEIQSIAARRFLPHVDEQLDRDRLSERRPAPADSELKVITNGWYTRSPEKWPPDPAAFTPLLISMHINQVTPKVVERFLSAESSRYLRQFGPVGARDTATRDLLLSHGIPSYFSGCMTLTIEPDPEIVRGEHILLVDVSPRVEAYVRRSTDRPVVHVSIRVDPTWSHEVKIKVAEYFIYLYQSAHAVVTTRLHATLPTIALGTPVAFVHQQNLHEVGRFTGIWELINAYSEEEFISGSTAFRLDAPPANPDRYLPIRDQLIERASAFTGYRGAPRHNWTSTSPGPFADVDMIEVVAQSFLSHYRMRNPRLQFAHVTMERIKQLRARTNALVRRG